MPTESRWMLRALCCCCNWRTNGPLTYRCKMCPSLTPIYFRQLAPRWPGFYLTGKRKKKTWSAAIIGQTGKHANWITQCQHDFIFFDVWDWLWCIKGRRHSKTTRRHLVNNTCKANPRQSSTGNNNLQYFEFAFYDFAKPAVCMKFIINRVTNHTNMSFCNCGPPSLSCWTFQICFQFIIWWGYYWPLIFMLCNTFYIFYIYLINISFII